MTIIEKVIAEPESFAGKMVPPAGKDYLSVYVSEETWTRGLEVASEVGTTLSGMVRVGIADILADASIPWDATTPRPRNAVIPVRE